MLAVVADEANYAGGLCIAWLQFFRSDLTQTCHSKSALRQDAKVFNMRLYSLKSLGERIVVTIGMIGRTLTYESPLPTKNVNTDPQFTDFLRECMNHLQTAFDKFGTMMLNLSFPNIVTRCIFVLINDVERRTLPFIGQRNPSESRVHIHRRL